MKVILLQDVQGSGKKGDMVEVSDGYARNFLLKKKLAKEANAQNMAELKAAEKSREHREQTELDKANSLGEKIKEKTLKISAKAGQGGKLFGSVTAKEIADEIKKQFGVEVDKRKVLLDGDIKMFGTYTVEVKLHAKVSVKMYVTVGEEG